MPSAQTPSMRNPDIISPIKAPPSPSLHSAPAFQWRALVSVVVMLSFLLMIISGVGLWIAPPGRIANWTDWTVFGLRKGEWADLHLWFGVVFVVASGFHVVLNWRPLLGYFKSKLTRQFGFRREWLAALLLCAMVFGGTRLEFPPFSTLLVFTEDIRESWERQSQRPPIPHAELLAVNELAEQAGVSLTNVLARLAASGIKDVSPEMRVADLAERNHISAQQLYTLMTAQEGEQEQRVGQGGGRSGGAGGGLGRRTLAAFCREEGIDLQTAQKRLESKGIQASGNQTLREIAENGGYEKPFEVLEVIRGR